jgi:hypothetical protein
MFGKHHNPFSPSLLQLTGHRGAEEIVAKAATKKDNVVRTPDPEVLKPGRESRKSCIQTHGELTGKVPETAP